MLSKPSFHIDSILAKPFNGLDVANGQNHAAKNRQISEVRKVKFV